MDSTGLASFAVVDSTLPFTSVRIWQVSLLQNPDTVAAFAETLSPDERERARRFHFERDRRRFIVARGTLRKIVATYLAVPAQRVIFSYGLRGKPFLPAEGNPFDLRFNLAHAHEMALLAFVCGREIGVDIEYVHALEDAGAIAKRFFAEREYQAWSGLPEGQQQVGFFHCWTRKEAYIKAIGDGLSKPLDQFEVSLALDTGVSHLMHVAGDPREVDRWSLVPLALEMEDYVAALAVEQRLPIEIENYSLLS